MEAIRAERGMDPAEPRGALHPLRRPGPARRSLELSAPGAAIGLLGGVIAGGAARHQRAVPPDHRCSPAVLLAVPLAAGGRRLRDPARQGQDPAGHRRRRRDGLGRRVAPHPRRPRRDCRPDRRQRHRDARTASSAFFIYQVLRGGRRSRSASGGCTRTSPRAGGSVSATATRWRTTSSASSCSTPAPRRRRRSARRRAGRRRPQARRERSIGRGAPGPRPSAGRRRPSFARVPSPVPTPRKVNMDLLEYQGKQLFARHGIPVPSGKPAPTVDEAVAAADEIGYPCVVKAQVKIGGRGKAGGIKIAQRRRGARARDRDPRHGHQGLHRPRGLDRGRLADRGRVLRLDRLRPLGEEAAGHVLHARAAWTSRRSPRRPRRDRHAARRPAARLPGLPRPPARVRGRRRRRPRPPGRRVPRQALRHVRRRGGDARRGQPADRHARARGRRARREGHARRQRALPPPGERRAARPVAPRTRRSRWPTSAA